MKLFLQMVFIFCYIHTCLRRLFHKSFCAIGKHNIGIGYENQRCLTALADLFTHRKHLVRRHTAGQSTQVGSLDHRTFRCRIGEENAKLYQISTGGSVLLEFLTPAPVYPSFEKIL